MKRSALFLAFLLAIPLSAQTKEAPELAVHPDTNFLKLPDGVYFGECVGVAVDSKRDIYIANRGKHPLMEFRPDGTFMRFIGEGLHIYQAPHSVAIDPQDNIWYVDAGSDLITPGPNQVIWSADGVSGRFYKLDLNGNLVGEFGKAGKLAGQLGWTHAIACPSENLIYAAEELNYRVEKLMVETEQPTR